MVLRLTAFRWAREPKHTPRVCFAICSILPRKVLGLLGILDDAGVVAWLYSKVGSKITPAIELKADMKLDEWFGPEIVRGIIFD